MSHKIVFLDRATIAPHIRIRRPAFAHEWIDHDQTTAQQAAERLQGATVAVLNKVPITEETLAQLPQLRLIAVAATGTDCVDKAACERRGIAVRNIRGYAVHTVPEHTFALILALRRNLMAYRASVQAGRWQESRQFCYFDYPIRDLHGARLGIIGSGALGQQVAQLGRAFGMVPLFAGRKGQTQCAAPYTPWDEVLRSADVISLHAPLTEGTRHLLSLPEFEAMQQRPVLINTARGALINAQDLVTALDRGLISGAGIDVTDGEPPPADSPLMQACTRPDLLLTPHVAWASDEAQQALTDQLIDNIESFVNPPGKA